jgi:hypothetical protein
MVMLKAGTPQGYGGRREKAEGHAERMVLDA